MLESDAPRTAKGAREPTETRTKEEVGAGTTTNEKNTGKMSAAKNQTTCWTRTRSSNLVGACERACASPSLSERPMARRRRPRPRSTSEGNDSANERKHSVLAVETARCSRSRQKKSGWQQRKKKKNPNHSLRASLKRVKKKKYLENVLFSLGVQSDRVRVRKLSDIDVYHS